ncbi:hypothetical protein [Holophaga foetida]|uniref:hypothetical protein n=1 Tax=Holophaga foetida TaxID=35839 RepID=UPI0002474288|nr:hypothetical protein [Holophaga foetida]
MDAAPLTALVQPQAVRALLAQVGAGTQQNLLALMGQSLEMTFQGMGPQGAQLVLPSGQVLVAQGELPFAQGTQLMVRVLSEVEGAVRLQIQEAKPPASPALLQPLLTGEAQPLLSRLMGDEHAESLAPTVRMLQQVLASVTSTVPSRSLALPLPLTQIEEAVAALPAELAQPLRQALGLPSGQALGQALKTWIESPAALPKPGAGMPDGSPVGQSTPATQASSAALPDASQVLAVVVQAFTGMMHQASTVPEAQQDFLSAWFRGLLSKAGGQMVPSSEFAAPSMASPVAVQSPVPLPSALLAKLPEAVASLPPKMAEFLRQALNIPEGQPLALGLRSWMESTFSEALAVPQELPDPRLREAGSVTLELAQRFEALVRQAPDFPKSQRALLTSWFRDLLVRAGGGESTARASGSEASRSLVRSSAAAQDAPSPAIIQRAVEGSSPGAASAAQAPLEEPAFWNKWIRGTVEALADPQVSPREAPFHALQAKEGTAYFELPAPWLPQGVVQLWVESDAPDEGRPEDETRRVFMGLHLSNLGDTRLGLELSGTNLRARVWTEHPERLATQEEALAKELEETGCQVSLRILPLGAGTAGLRSMVVGNSWQGLG